jgi:DNA polymerase-3 subunit gamma/tau
MLELVEGLAEYGADYRNFARELLLHVREILLVKLAPPDSPLVAAILPEERDALQSLAAALSEEDLLRGLDLLTRAESELRNATDPRVALDLALLKLVHMRRLVPFAELVARVERLAGGSPAAALPPARPAEVRPAPARLSAPKPPPVAAPAPLPAPAAPAATAVAPAPAAAPPAQAGSAEAILATMVGLCQGRPSLAAPLRAATARLEGDALSIEVPPDFEAFGTMHAEEYRDLAKKAAGRPLRVTVAAGRAAAGEASAAPAAPSPEEDRRQKLREEAERDGAVQEALDLFDGRVVDVREAKASREDA